MAPVYLMYRGLFLFVEIFVVICHYCQSSLCHSQLDWEADDTTLSLSDLIGQSSGQAWVSDSSTGFPLAPCHSTGLAGMTEKEGVVIPRYLLCHSPVFTLMNIGVTGESIFWILRSRRRMTEKREAGDDIYFSLSLSDLIGQSSKKSTQ